MGARTHNTSESTGLVSVLCPRAIVQWQINQEKFASLHNLVPVFITKHYHHHKETGIEVIAKRWV